MIFEAKEKFHLTDKFISGYKRKKVDWGPLGYLVFKRTYARPIPGSNRTEEYWETCRRVVEGCYTVQLNHCRNLRLPWKAIKSQLSAQTMYDLMFNFKFLPPGRGLWIMGTPYIYERGSAALNNCGFVSTEGIDYDFTEPFTFLMDQSLLGVGVSFDTKGAGKVIIKDPKIDENEVFVVDDSKEGWTSVVEVVLSAYVGKRKLPKEIDYSQIRPEGAPIKTFGGVCPGSKPLEDCIAHLHKLLGAYVGKKIDSTLIVDIFNVLAKCVVSGGVRRCATLSLGDPLDKEYLALKDPEKHGEELLSHRWASNNSVAAEIGMDYSEVSKQTAKGGEPGFVWLDACKHYGRMKDGYGNHDTLVEGVNPCVPYSTRILTKNGYQPIGSLVGNLIEVWNGHQWSSVTPKQTGENEKLLKVELSDGTSLKCTPHHKWVLKGDKRVEAQELETDDKLEKFNMPVVQTGKELPHAYTQGFYSGDGTTGRQGAYLYGVKKQLKTVLEGEASLPTSTQQDRLWMKFPKTLKSKQYVPTYSSLQSRLAWFAGLIDSDGSLYRCPNSIGLRITSIDKPFLHETRLMLTTLGVQGRITKTHSSGMQLFQDSKGNSREVFRQDCYCLTITPVDTSHLFSLGMKTYRVVSDKLNPKGTSRRFVKIESVSVCEEREDVFCFTESINNTGCFEGIITGQCAEQGLESYELCNLVETFPSRHDSYDEYAKTLKFAYLYAKTVTLIPTHNERTNQIVLRNRRIGLSQSGIIESFQKHGRREHFDWCEKGFKYVDKLDEFYSHWLCVPKSIKKTTVKPSGTVSLLPGVTPGVHFPHSEYYFRTIRIQNGSPLIEPLREAGYRIEESEYGDNTQVIYFPVHEANFDRAKEEITIWEQLETTAQMQYWWSDNLVSVTITFKPEEAKDIPRALELYETRLKAVSFLPLTDHKYPQAPYQTIDKEEYEKAVEKLKRAKLRGLNTDEITDEFCTTDVCELKNASATKEK